jgi:hypothetical protein
MPSDWKRGDVVVLAQSPSGTTEINLGKCSDEVLGKAVKAIIEDVRPDRLVAVLVESPPRQLIPLYRFPTTWWS